MTARTLTSASLMPILTASYLAAQSPAPAQPRPPQTYPAFLQAQYASLKRYIIGSAEKMPAEHFGFKPAPEVMTYAGLPGTSLMCSTASATPSREAFAYCDVAFAALTNENALEMLTMGTAPNQRQVARAN